ncbi:hypothetical protein LI058_07860 [Clostridium perfringens]|uniref:Uncharacterized protein n=2 Tax=Clostridium perfringens TaxID=1502 RepID=A0AAV3FDY1_CLOPF|nr:hypothetical protein [Clostridium perfringens]EHK2404539.1 hypothetical protein [Clostridium perfringens]EIA17593.1 hypothetical protein HA1_06422 [Clostridium perfringens F262]EJT6153944.1 hypothetical protein [Clostridium perfringens]ELC8344268.1 hypothetical protein [Clostridium perfringens]ELC8347986.1 hypothetical protein [Clostridium perfringens]
MNEKIKNVLDSIRFKNSYLERDSDEECVVYNYFSNGIVFADNKERIREYTILLNVYSNKRIDFRNETVRKAMLEAGFKGGQVQVPFKLKNGFYNTAIKFKGFI